MEYPHYHTGAYDLRGAETKMWRMLSAGILSRCRGIDIGNRMVEHNCDGDGAVMEMEL